MKPVCRCGLVDAHTHWVPAEIPAYLGQRKGVPWPSMAPADSACDRHVMIEGRIYRTVPSSCWEGPRRVEEMTAMGVAHQVVSPMPELLSYWMATDDALMLTRFLNEDLSALCLSDPQRFTGLGAVPLQDVPAAIAELEHCLRLGLAGAEIGSNINGKPLGHPDHEPFFAAAASMGAALFVHALKPAGMDRLVGPPALEQVVAFPGEIGLAAASLITSGLIARLPGLRSEALLWSLLVFGSGIGLVQHAPGRDRLPALRLAALLASWGGVALALLIHPGQIGVRVTALLLSALVAAVLARVAQRRGLRDLQLAQTLVAQALLLLALLGLGPLLLDNLLLTVLLLLESGLFLLFGLLSQERLIRRSGWWLVVLLSLAPVLQGLLRLDFDLVTPTAASLRDTGLVLSSAALLVGLASQYTRLALAASWPPLLGWLAAALVVIATSLLPPPLWQPGCALVGSGGLLLAERRLRPAGLASGSLAAVAVAHLLAWHGLLEVERPTGQLLVLLLPLLLLAGLLTATASRSGRRCLGIDLLGLDLALAAYCLLQPISPLLPGVAWLLLSLLGLELADRLRRPEADHVLALAACMLAGFVSHFLLVTSRSPAVVVLPGLVLRARLAIELFALAVTLRWGTFQARPRLRQAEPWQQLQPCFLEFSLLVVATTILSELDSLLRPLAWSLLALLLLSPWLRRRFAARCQIYALLTYWLAIAATPAILGSAGMPSPRWFEQPALLSTLAILLQVLFLVLSRRWLCSEALADPGGWPLLGWIGARLSGRSQRWLGYPLFLAVALHLAGRYDQGLLTLLWTLEATVIFGLGVLQRDQQVRIVALLALGLCLYRLLAVDMAAADPVLRGLVFVGVGLLMLAMNVISNRFRDRIR